MTRRHPSQLVDTGERKAIADVVRDSVEDIFDKTPSPGISMDTAKIIAQDVCKEYHRDHCPAKSIGEKVEALEDRFESVSATQNKMIGALMLLTAATPFLVWLLNRAPTVNTISRAHAAQIETKDAGR